MKIMIVNGKEYVLKSEHEKVLAKENKQTSQNKNPLESIYNVGLMDELD